MTDEIHASQIIDAIGEDVLENELRLTKRNIRHIRSSGTFAAGWYEPVKAVCDREGIPCPLAAFNWKRPQTESAAQ